MLSNMGLATETEESIYKVQWDSLIQRQIDAVGTLPAETAWPRDVLFRYYNTMEKLQENLQVFCRLGCHSVTVTQLKLVRKCIFNKSCDKYRFPYRFSSADY